MAMQNLKKYSSLILFISILSLILVVLVKNKTIDADKKEISKLQAIIESQKNLEEDTIDTKDSENTDTFEEDIEWFITKVYEANNLTALYEDINTSVNQTVLETLIGEEIPPKKDEIEEYTLDREVTEVDVYGKYTKEGIYKALVSFNVFYDFKEQSQDKKILVSLEIKNEDDAWIITNFEEFSE